MLPLTEVSKRARNVVVNNAQCWGDGVFTCSSSVHVDMASIQMFSVHNGKSKAREEKKEEILHEVGIKNVVVRRNALFSKETKASHKKE